MKTILPSLTLKTGVVFLMVAASLMLLPRKVEQAGAENCQIYNSATNAMMAIPCSQALSGNYYYSNNMSYTASSVGSGSSYNYPANYYPSGNPINTTGSNSCSYYDSSTNTIRYIPCQNATLSNYNSSNTASNVNYYSSQPYANYSYPQNTYQPNTGSGNCNYYDSSTNTIRYIPCQNAMLSNYNSTTVANTNTYNTTYNTQNYSVPNYAYQTPAYNNNYPQRYHYDSQGYVCVPPNSVMGNAILNNTYNGYYANP